MDLKDWAKIQESLLRSKLKIFREFFRGDAEPEQIPRSNRKS